MPAEETGTGTTPAPAIPAPAKEGQTAKASQAKEPKKHPPVMPPAPSARSKPPGGPLRVGVPAKEAENVTAPAPATPAPAKEGQAARTAPPAPEKKLKVATGAPQPPEQLRVAVLSPAVKLDMVRAVRRRIADESAWLPGKVKGAAAYAGKMQNRELVLLEADSPEASRFSLFGAFLLEMHARRVVQTAVGRRRFLDEEIPEAIRELLLEQMSDEERERTEDPLATTDVLSISHAQCLAVLDALEERYSQRVEQVQNEKAKRRLGNVRLPDLIRKLEKKVPVSPEEVATALYHELMEVRRRLDRMEARLTREKPVSTDESR